MTKTRTSKNVYSKRFWDALDGLEVATDDLSRHILRRTTEAPSKASAKTKTATVSKHGDDSEHYIERLANLTRTITILRECLEAPARDLPEAAKSRSLRRIVHPEISGSPETAKRARIGRAAKRHGLSYREWVRRYGMVDKLPERA